MPVFVDKLTGQVIVIDALKSGSGSGATTTYPEVNSYAQLPSATLNSGKIYVVRQPSGTYMINRKDAGLYYSNGISWTRLGDTPSYFNDDNFQIYDGTDNTKQVRFQLSGITSGVQRAISLRDSDGTIAYLSDVGSKVDKLVFAQYTATTGLQQVTQIGATTNIESTFNGGLVLNKIRPTGDTMTAFQIRKADGITPIINIDTVSGYTGIGTVAPQGLLHTYGTNNTGDPSLNFQPNSIIIDGVVDGDKNIAWYDNGNPKWFAQTYRSEDAEFWYLYNNETDNDLLTGSRGGLFAINKATNILNLSPAQIIGTGLNDLIIRGLYSKDFNTVYQLKINSTTGTTDTYVWRKSVDDGFTYSPYSPVSAVTTTQVELEFGVLINFLKTTGHTTGDVFQFIGIAQLPTATLSVSPYPVNEILVTNDYTQTNSVYRDVTGVLNGGVNLPITTVFPTGSTGGAILLGFIIPIHTLNFTIRDFANGVSLVVEYFNPVLSAWTGINYVNNNYLDNTNNFTTSGRISWSPTTFINWNLAPLSAVTTTQTPTYYSQFYWIRIRTASPPTKSAGILNISVGTDKRFTVYGTNQDLTPNFYVDSIGRTNIGGGNITGKNVLQINNNVLQFTNPLTVSDSLVEIDSEDSSAVDLKIKLVSSDALGPGLTFAKARGTLSNSFNLQSGDTMYRIDARVKAANVGKLITQITSTYMGDGNSQHGDIRFSTGNGGDPTERVRINEIGTGFGVKPTAVIDIRSGTTTIAPMKFRNGSLTLVPQVGAIEFSGSSWYGTPTGGTRKTFAFLESPKFTGVVQLPSGTLLNNVNLINYVVNTGGTNNPTLTKKSLFNSYTGTTNTRITKIENDVSYISGITDTKLNITDFNTYTGSTIPWTKVSKVGSSLADLQTRNAVDLNVSVSDWSVTNVDDYIQKNADYIESTQGSGRLTPENPLTGNLTPILHVSGGTGYINYSGFHKLISWSAHTFNFSGFTEGTYYVYVDTNSVVQISTTEPSGIQQIKLGVLYFGGTFIGALNSTGSIVDNTTTRLFDYLTRLGLFIYDNGGLVSVYSGNTLGIVSSQLKVQNGLVSTQNSEISTANAITGKFNNYYNTADQGWVNNYYFNIGKTGIVPVNRWNDITKNSNNVLTAFTVTFTQGSKLVTSASNLTSFISTDDFIYKTSDGHQYMNPVSAITWTGSQTNISLETVYLGTSGNGTVTVDHALPRLGTSYAKDLVLRTPDDQMVLILGQTKYSGDTAAKLGVFPSTPPSLTSYIMKMAYLVVYSGTTNLAGHIFDIRPLPFSQVQGGQQGAGNVITVHGQLSGLGADDHLQYLRTDGTRALTGIQKYATQPTFTTDLDLVSKKYVDDTDGNKLSISVFTGYTATTAPATYLKISNFNTYSAVTLTNINSRLLKTTFNTYTGTTAPATYLSISNFNLYTGTTAPATYLKISNFNTYSGLTLSNINSRLLISNFNIYSGTTVPANYYNKTEINSYSATTNALIGTKAPIASPTFTGIPAAPTAAVNSNTTQIATTAFVVGQASNVNPLVNGAVAIGTSLKYSREDHVHPIDTTRLAVSAFNTYSANTVTYANNGLTRSGANVHLGGVLTGATTIGLGTFNMVFTSTTGTLRYGSDLSAQYGIRSLVDKGFVTGITSTLLSISAFNTYSASTLTNINSRLLTSAFNTYSASTLTNINSRLLTSAFNTYSANTVTYANNGLTRSGANVHLGGLLTGATTIGLGTNSLTVSGTTGTLKYATDQSANYTKRSVIDQGYYTGNTLYTSAQLLVYASGTTDLNVTTPVSIPFNRLIRNNPIYFTYTGGTTIKILVAGNYDISFVINGTNNNATSHSISASMYKNGSSVVETTTTCNTVATSGFGAALVLVATQQTFAANDIIQIRGFRLSTGGGSFNTTANAAFLSIIKKY